MTPSEQFKIIQGLNNAYYQNSRTIIYYGDNRNCLKKIPDNSIDLLVTDPNYGIKFMGKTWDVDVPAVETWIECRRVLKPGAFAFIMSSPRQDVLSEMIVRVRQAGFDTNFTSIYWAYACLSDDTEVLTKGGWEHWHNTNTFKRKEILIYDHETDSYRWETPFEWHEYKIEDTCYRIKSDFTDQFVTRNHRVLVERKGKLLLQPAETLGQEVSVPYLEGMPTLPETILDISSVVKKEEGSGKVLFNKLQAESEYTQIPLGKWQTHSQNARSPKTKTERIYDGRTESCLERWCNIFQDTWQLCWNKVCSLSSRILTNGTQGRLYNGTPSVGSTASKEMSFENRSCASYQPQPDRQQVRESGSLYKQSGSQVVRKRKGYKTTLATVRIERYSGIVFCPTVSTGCFVARRNGMIFLTGNSGFPKAMNISKAVDKKLGAERELISGTPKPEEYSGLFDQRSSNERTKDGGVVSPEAKALEGSYAGFQPKPAVEVIIVAMKPLSEKTFVEQALADGKGITWLNDGRIPYQNKTDYDELVNNFKGGLERATDSKETWKLHGGGWKLGEGIDIPDDNKGRFPANLLVSDDTLNNGKITTATIDKNLYQGKTSSWFASEHTRTSRGDTGSFSRYFDLDKWFEEHLKKLPKEVQDTFPFLIVPKAAKSERDEYVEYIECDVGHNRFDTCATCGGTIFQNPKRPSACKCEVPVRQNNKIKGNFHPTAKPLILMNYLITLGSREGDIVLDPHAGSGTTCIAARMLNRYSIGIDMEEAYLRDIAVPKLKEFAKQRTMFEFNESEV